MQLPPNFHLVLVVPGAVIDSPQGVPQKSAHMARQLEQSALAQRQVSEDTFPVDDFAYPAMFQLLRSLRRQPLILSPEIAQHLGLTI